jgi:SAM-dependent methyltransferase
LTSPIMLPVPDPERLAELKRALELHYDAEFPDTRFWPGHKQWWLDAMGIEHEAVILRFLQRFDSLIGWQGKRCLDMGCGSGSALIALQVLGATAVGIDKMMTGDDQALARVRAAVYGMEVAISEGDATRLDFADGSFDVVFSNSVVEHVAEVDSYVSEAFRVLRPGGWFILTSDNRVYPREGHTGVWFGHWLPYPAFRSLANRKLGHAREAPLEVYPRSYRRYRRMGIEAGFLPRAGRLDSVLASSASSSLKNRVARYLKASRLPVDLVFRDTLVVFQKP